MEQKIATAELSLHVIHNGNEQSYVLPKSALDQLIQLSNDTENSLAEEKSKSQTEEDEEVEENKDENQSRNDIPDYEDQSSNSNLIEESDGIVEADMPM